MNLNENKIKIIYNNKQIQFKKDENYIKLKIK